MMNEAIQSASTAQVSAGIFPKIEFSPSFDKILDVLGGLKIENPACNKTGEFKNRYADLPAILAVIKPVTEPAGIRFNQFPLYDPSTNCAVLLTVIKYEDEWIRCYSSCPISTSKRATETPMQAWGAAITYLRRTSLCAIFNLAQEEADNDGSETAFRNPVSPGRQSLAPVREVSEAERQQAIAALKNSTTMEELTLAHRNAWELSTQEGWRKMVTDLASKRKREILGTAAA